MPSYIVKATPTEDWYCLWSTIGDAPCRWGSRAEMERASCDPAEVAAERFHRADKNGTSAAWENWPEEDMPFGWSDESFLLMNSCPDCLNDDGYWLLPRKNLRAFCEALDAGADTTPLCVWEQHDDLTPTPAADESGAGA